MIFNPPNFYLNVFDAKDSPVRLLVRDSQCLLPARKSRSVLPVFEFFLIINLSSFARSGSAVTFKFLYNALILSRFSFCLKCEVNVASVVSGTVHGVLSTLLLSSVL